MARRKSGIPEVPENLDPQLTRFLSALRDRLLVEDDEAPNQDPLDRKPDKRELEDDPGTLAADTMEFVDRSEGRTTKEKRFALREDRQTGNLHLLWNGEDTGIELTSDGNVIANGHN